MCLRMWFDAGHANVINTAVAQREMAARVLLLPPYPAPVLYLASHSIIPPCPAPVQLLLLPLPVSCYFTVSTAAVFSLLCYIYISHIQAGDVLALSVANRVDFFNCINRFSCFCFCFCLGCQVVKLAALCWCAA